MQRSYSIYEAKAQLSRLLRAVKAGRDLTVTERGRPIARLVPYRARVSLTERFGALAERGLLGRRVRKPIAVLGRRRGALARFLKERE